MITRMTKHLEKTEIYRTMSKRKVIYKIRVLNIRTQHKFRRNKFSYISQFSIDKEIFLTVFSFQYVYGVFLSLYYYGFIQNSLL